MKRITRRNFVKAGLATALVGGGCLSLGLKEALVQAKETGKPLMTSETLNGLFANAKANKALAAEARQDLRGFIHQRFTLTRQQNQILQTLSKTNVEKFRDVLKPVSEQGGSIKVSFSGDEMKQNHAASAPLACRTRVEVTTPVGSASVDVEVT